MRLTRNVNFLFSHLVKLSHYPAPFDQVAKLELDNPKKKNALSIGLLSHVPPPSISSTPPSRISISSLLSGLASYVAASKAIFVLEQT